VRCAPKMDPAEADKFVLLPAGAPHDATIFADAPRRSGGADPPPAVPPPRTLGRGPLPYPPEDFVGRAVAMYRVLAALRRRRLVVLTAPAGGGKTAVAAALAQHQKARRAFGDGVLFLRVGELRSVDDLGRALEDALQLPPLDAAATPAAVRRALPPLSRAFLSLRDADALIVLDGVDALAATPAFGAALCELLETTLHVRLLLTAAAPLAYVPHLPAKLTTTALGALSAADAARLFARRVGRPLAEILPPDAPPTLESLAAEPALARLRGQPGRIVRCASAVCAEFGATAPATRGEVRALVLRELLREDGAAA